MQAIIVRIMKAARTMDHNSLLTEVAQTVRLFTPTVSMIKRNIEVLIDKEYLQREDASMNTYSYIA